MAPVSKRVEWCRGLGAGVLWLMVLFVWDTIDSYYLIRSSTKRLRSDDEVTELLTDAIVGYVSRMGLAYLLMGLLAGVTWVLLQRVRWPEVPQRSWSWWARFGGVALFLTLLGYGLQATLFPPLYDHIPGINWWAEWVTPGVWLIMAAMVVGRFGWTVWVSWAGHDRKDLGIRVLMLGLWFGLLFVVFRNPAPDDAVDNEGINVVVIGVDALRPDHLGFYGYHLDTSPNIDALLEESVVFDQAYTPLARTYPAWVALLSGTLPQNTGIRDNLPEDENLVPDQVLIPQVFQQAGYETTFVTDDSRFSYMVPEMGFDNVVQPPVGMENFAISVNEPRYRAFHGLMHNWLGFGLIPSAAYNQSFGKSYRPELFIDKAVDTLSVTSKEGPFFYAVHTCVLHVPGDRVHPWHRMYGQASYRGKNRFHYSRSGTALLDEEEEKGLPASEIAAQDIRIYDAGIDMADRLVEQVVAELKTSGLWDNTVVVLLSDHGEEFWSDELPYRYNGPNHGFHPYGEGQNRILMAIRVPESLQTQAWVPRQVEQPSRLIDLAPTLAGLFSLEWPAESDGQDLLPLLNGEEDDDRLVYIETGFSEKRYWPSGHMTYPKGMAGMSKRFGLDTETGRVFIKPEMKPHLVAAKDRVLQDGDWKLIWRAMKSIPRVELYNRREDPLNIEDLSTSRPDIVARLGLLLQPYLEADGIDSPLFERWKEIAEHSRGVGTETVTPDLSAETDVSTETQESGK